MQKVLGPLALVVASFALGVALWRGDARPPPPPEPEAPVAEAPPGAALETRLGTLELRLDGLAARVRQLEQQPRAPADAMAGGAPTASLQQEVADLRREVLSLQAGEALHSEGGRAFLKGMVREAQADIAADRRQQQLQQWVQAQQAQVQGRSERLERWQAFVSQARLSYQPEQELLRRVQEEEARRQALVEKVQAGEASPRDVRQQLRTLRQQNDQAMKALLDEAQYQQYLQARREEQSPQRGRQRETRGPREPARGERR